ncbi:MAG: M20/M25/M40 family metallo-hydrolase [Pseudomonadota bacterium]
MDKERLIKTFCELVKIPSESPDDKEFISYMEKLLQKEGANTIKDDFGNLVAKFPAKNSSSKESVLFCCHGDTVKPGKGIEPIVEEKVIRSNGSTILAGDDKAGIAEVLEMLRSAKKHPPIEFLIARCEEITPSGVEALDYSLIDSKFGYVIDMDTPDEVIVGGPTYVVFNVKYKGRSAHAGMCPEKGISAIQVLSDAICNLRLGKIDEETTANVGVVKGGLSMNSVPEDSEILAECRSLDDKKALKLAEEMKAVFKKSADKFGATVDIDVQTSLKAYSIPKDSKVVKIAVEAIRKNGLKEDVKSITGGSDATHLNHAGLQVAALGIGGRKMHSTDEFIVIDEMVSLTRIITTLVEDLA